jgi:hypothetical protein
MPRARKRAKVRAVGSTTSPHFKTAPFQDRLDAVLAAVPCGAADRDEALRTVALIDDGDADSWLREWTALAGATWAAAAEDPTAERYLRAGTYYGAALALIGRTDGSVDERALWERQRSCWDLATELLGGEPTEIPYDGTTLPGYVFTAQGGGRRPLVVIDHGGHAPTSSAWVRGGAEATARGYHWMTFDGPGREAALVRQQLRLRHDWEAVLTPVADAMLARADVDGERIAVIGVGHGGYGVPRALAFEHRFAAAVADPGVLDLLVPWLARLPESAREPLERGNRAAFEREVHLAGLFTPDAWALLARRGRAYGGGDSPFELFERVRRYRLERPELARIETPLLICEHADDQLWPGQARELGAELGERCELLTSDATGDQRAVFDWLERFLRY